MKTKLREMRPSDVSKVEGLLREQNERDNTSYSMPRVFDSSGSRLPSIPLALVAVDEDTGEVVQGTVYEQTVEGMTFGINPKATVCSMHEHPAVFYLLRERGYKDLHILVPGKRVKQMKHGLETILEMSATGLTHFYRMLDPEENAEVKKFYEQQKEPANV